MMEPINTRRKVLVSYTDILNEKHLKCGRKRKVIECKESLIGRNSFSSTGMLIFCLLVNRVSYSDVSKVNKKYKRKLLRNGERYYYIEQNIITMLKELEGNFK